MKRWEDLQETAKTEKLKLKAKCWQSQLSAATVQDQDAQQQL